MSAWTYPGDKYLRGKAKSVDTTHGIFGMVRFELGVLETHIKAEGLIPKVVKRI